MSLDWQERALCAQVGGELWFPERGGSNKVSKALCAVCPVKRQCLEYALSLPKVDDQSGIFGGLSVRERNALRRAAA